MKKLLLIAALLLSVVGLHAQSKTTGVVTLMSGMTAKLDLDNATTTATLSFTGPSDRWIALQFGSFTNSGGMASGQDLVYYNGTTLVDAVHNGIGATPSTDGANNWTVTSNTVAGTTRTIVATRAFNTAAPGDYTFVYTNNDIDFAYAKGASASFALANHGGSNRGYALNRAFTCIPPSNPTASAQSFCAGATVANLMATGVAGATFNWYAAATGGSALAGTATLTNATYHVSQTVGGCESARVSVAVTINTTAQPSASATQQFCSQATVANLTATGTGTINWYDVAAGGSPLAGTTVLTAGNYYVSQTIGSCESTRATVAVTFNTAVQPSANATQQFCSQATVANLTATGTGTINWYNVPTGGSPLAGTTALTAGNYYVSQTIGSCESTRATVAVTIQTTPQPSAGTAQQFCQGATVSSLVATGNAAINWYTIADGGSPLAGTTLLTTGNYYVSQTQGTCESTRITVAVTINAIPAAPGGADIQQFTAGETIADLEVTVLTGATITWYMQDNGGDMVEVPLTTPLVDGASYYVTQTLNGCESEIRMIQADEVLGTGGFEMKNLKAYPNPVSDVLTIINSTALDRITVYNMLGQELIAQKANGDKTEINVSALPAGTYTVKVHAANGASASLKVMKQ